MTLLEDKTNVFILRIWLESREMESVCATWRGVIIHVESGQQQYLNAPSEILDFIKPYTDCVADEFGCQN